MKGEAYKLRCESSVLRNTNLLPAMQFFLTVYCLWDLCRLARARITRKYYNIVFADALQELIKRFVHW